MSDPMEVSFARLEGKVDALTQTVDIRMIQTSAEASSAFAKAKAAHQRLDQEGQALRDEFRAEVRELHDLLAQMRRGQARMVGVGIGIGAMSGLVSGLIVLLLSGSGA